MTACRPGSRASLGWKASKVLYRPIVELRSWHLTKVSQVPAQQSGVCCQGDASNTEVHSLQSSTLSSYCLEACLGFSIEGQHIHLEEGSPDGLELFIGQDNLDRLTSARGVGQPALYLFLEADDARRDIVGRKIVQSDEQSVARRLLAPLQDGQVISIEQDSQNRLAFELAAADESAKARDFSKSLVPGKVSHDLLVPRPRLVTG